MSKQPPPLSRCARWLSAWGFALAMTGSAAHVAHAAPLAAPLDEEVQGVTGIRTAFFPDDEFGGRIYVLQAGPVSDSAAPPLVLIHGLGEAGVRDFYPILQSLAEKRRVIAFDLPGFGRSSKGNEEYTPARYVEVVRRLIDALAKGKADVVGHSMGGAIALMHAGTHPQQVRRLVLVDAAGILHREAFVGEQVRATFDPARKEVPNVVEAIEAAAGRLLRKGREFEPPPELVLKSAWLRKGALGGEPGRIAALGLITTNLGTAIAAVQAPTLLLWGAKDHIAPLRTAQLLVDRLARAHLRILEGVGHVPMREAPSDTTAHLRRHLDGVLSEEGPRSPTEEASSRGDYSCEGQSDVRITGRFETLTLSACPRASLVGVVAERLVMRDSSAIAVGCRVRAGIELASSSLTMTGGEIKGAPPLQLARSRLDLAGVRLSAGDHAAAVTRTSRVLCSVCTIEDAAGGVSHLHGERVLTPGLRHL